MAFCKGCIKGDITLLIIWKWEAPPFLTQAPVFMITMIFITVAILYNLIITAVGGNEFRVCCDLFVEPPSGELLHFSTNRHPLSQYQPSSRFFNLSDPPIICSAICALSCRAPRLRDFSPRNKSLTTTL